MKFISIIRHSSFFCFFSIFNNANILAIFALFKCIQFTQADDYRVCLSGVMLGPCACIIRHLFGSKVWSLLRVTAVRVLKVLLVLGQDVLWVQLKPNTDATPTPGYSEHILQAGSWTGSRIDPATSGHLTCFVLLCAAWFVGIAVCQSN